MQPVIQLKEVTRVYNNSGERVYALNAVSLEVSRGEFTALAGPSGSGKTTLLNIAGALDKPDSGEVIVNGLNLKNISEGKLYAFRLENIGFVFQSFNLIPVLTAEENIEFVMQLRDIGKKERADRVKELMESLDLKNLAGRRPAEMSGGQQQRVAVARAVASRPEIVIADEPTASLDAQAAMKLIQLMQKLRENEQITFLFSSHDPRVLSSASRVLTMEDARIVDDSTHAGS